jgi:hypothetical protein
MEFSNSRFNCFLCGFKTAYGHAFFGVNYALLLSIELANTMEQSCREADIR